MSKSEKLAKNLLLPVIMESLERLDEILRIMTEPHTEFPAAENSDWVQDYFAYTHSLEERGLFNPHILKIQAPQYGGEEGKPEAFITNKDKTIMAFMPYDEVMMTWLEGRPKVYLEARIWADGTIQLVRLTEDREW